MDPATTGSLNPSPLGRTNSTNTNGHISYVATGGPTGGGWGQGAPVVPADNDTQKTWSLAFDVDAWGPGSPIINSLGAKYYMWRTVYRNFAHYDENTSNYNIKNWRCWARASNTVNSPGQGYPDMYFSTSNQRLTCELTLPGGGYPFTPGPEFPRMGQLPGSADYIAYNNCIEFDGGLPATPNRVTFENWYSEEMVYQKSLDLG